MMQEHSSTSNFKKNIYYVFIISIFGLASFITINFFGLIYEDAAKKNKINKFNQLRFEEFYNSENIDLVFIGSSHSYCTFDPEIVDAKINTNSYQMGMPLQHPDASYYTLLEILNHQDINNVVLEVYWDMLDDDFDLKQADTLFQVLENDKLKKEYIKDVFPFNEKVKYKIGTARYMQDFFTYNNSQLLSFLKNEHDIYEPIKHVEGEEYYRSKGYVYADFILDKIDGKLNNQFENYDGNNYRISSVQKKFIKKIVDLCKEKDINLFFVTAPIANVSMEHISNYNVIHRQINEMANDFGISYIDFNLINEKEKILDDEHFRDDAHLNHNGVKIISTLYANYLTDKIK